MTEPITVPKPLFEYSYELQTPVIAPADRDIRALDHHYVIKEALLKDFLKAHRALPALLVGISSALRLSFGDQPITSLEVVTAGDDVPVLRVVVSWPGSLDAAETALKKFDEGFWLENCVKASGNIVVTYELI